MLKKIGYLIFLTFVFPSLLFSQQRLNSTTDQGCSFSGKTPVRESLYGFKSSQEANQYIEKILVRFGLDGDDITIKAANVENAQATIIDDERYILYSEEFMMDIGSLNQGKEYWVKLGILAHEIGHHVKGHTLGEGGSRPEIELEADEWSGFALYQLGATLDQAQLAMETLAEPYETPTHPPKSARNMAVAVGYKSASELAGNVPVNRRPTNVPEPKPDKTIPTNQPPVTANNNNRSKSNSSTVQPKSTPVSRSRVRTSTKAKGPSNVKSRTTVTINGKKYTSTDPNGSISITGNGNGNNVVRSSSSVTYSNSNSSSSSTTITGNKQISNIYNGNLTIASRSSLVINGTVTGNITIKNGGKLILYGILTGNVINEGGTFSKIGIHNGRVTSNR